MKKTIWLVVVALMFMFGGATEKVFPWSYDILPIGGIVEGLPGETVTWDYTITNDTTEWLSVDFISINPTAGPTPDIIFNFPIISPAQSVNLPTEVSFHLLSLFIDPSAAIGLYASGTFGLSGFFYESDPSLDGLSPIGEASDPYSVPLTYTANVASVPVPEPTTILLLGSGLVALGGA